jgi:hypothetical protein
MIMSAEIETVEDIELWPDSEATQARPKPIEVSGVFRRGERRLGVRAATKFPAFLKTHGLRVRTRTVDLSTTGIVLDFRYAEIEQVSGLSNVELLVPGLEQPVRAVVRPVRKMGKFQAFEFISIRQVDRLTLAEHLDRIRKEVASRG